MEIEARPTGRPPGSVESPFNLIKRDLKEDIALAKRVRQLMAREIERFECEKLNIGEQIEMRKQLPEWLRVLNTNLTNKAKLVIQPSVPEKDEEEQEGVIEALVDGGGKK